LAERVIAERCEAVLGGVADRHDDPAAFVVGVAEVVRMGEMSAAAAVDDVAFAIEALAAERTWQADVALAAATRVLTTADETRAVRDVGRIVAGRSSSATPASPPDGGLAVPWLESQFSVGGALFPRGFPEPWLGESIEAHGVPTGPGSSISLAVRWHGARPAVLWEQFGERVRLTSPVLAPDWHSMEAAGDALWLAPSS
jgi:hypothetical protein